MEQGKLGDEKKCSLKQKRIRGIMSLEVFMNYGTIGRKICRP
jgi:hypothetical protein